MGLVRRVISFFIKSNDIQFTTSDTWIKPNDVTSVVVTGRAGIGDGPSTVAGRVEMISQLIEQNILTVNQAKSLLGVKNEKKKATSKRRRNLETPRTKSRIKKLKSKSSKRTKKKK